MKKENLNWLNSCRNEPDYEAWRKKVLKRDKYKCRMPNCGSKYRCEVHHIIKYANSVHLRTVVENGITLCRKCHMMIRNKENYFVELFFNIVNDK